MTIRVRPLRANANGLPEFNVTTRGRAPWRLLSPMLLGPVQLAGGQTSQNVENAWQYSKVYPEHLCEGQITEAYWDWAYEGWDSERAERYPMGKGSVPEFSLCGRDRLGYIEARKRIYFPLYREAVISNYRTLLVHLWEESRSGDIVLRDFDAYDHLKLGYSYQDVIDDPKRKMGHGFVLAMILDGFDPA